MSARGYISLKTKLAAALCQMLRVDADGNFVPVISYAEAKRLTEDEIISRFHMDHYPVRKDDGGPDAHWNLVPRPVPEHREKTAKVDVPQISKRKRIVVENERHDAVMDAKAGRGDPPPRKRSSLQSRNTFSKPKERP